MKKAIFNVLIVSLVFSMMGCSRAGAVISLKAGDTLVSPEIEGTKNEVAESIGNESSMELIGNTAGNLDNFGYYAYKDGWVYYGLDQLRNGKGLYKKKIDDEKAIKLSDGLPRYINVVGDWIYYLSFKEGIYRIKTDGTEEKLICKDENLARIYVYGDWIVCRSDKLYKMKTDGSEKVILSDKRVFKIMPDKDKLYFMAFEIDKKPKKVVYEIEVTKENPTAKKLLEADMKKFNIPTLSTLIQDGWIYYIDYKIENGRIAKIKVDGTEKTILTDKPAVNLNIEDGWIYYLEAQEQPKLDDGKVTRGPEPYMNLKYKLHKITIDGNEKTLVLDKELDFFRTIYLIKDDIYLTKDKEVIKIGKKDKVMVK